VLTAGGPDKVVEVLKASIDDFQAGSGANATQHFDPDRWSAQLEPATFVLLGHIGVTPDHPQIQKAKVGLLNMKEQMQPLIVQCCAYLEVQQPDLEPSHAFLFLWLVTLLVLTMHFLQFVVRTLVATFTCMSRAIRGRKRAGSSLDSAPKEVFQEVAPTVTPVVTTVVTKPEQEEYKPPAAQQENIFNSQNMALSEENIFNKQSRRVDSPAKKRQAKQDIVTEQEVIIVTRPEPVKKTRGSSKRMASPKPKEEEKPRAPENWGDDADCKSMVLLTMLNSADEEMMVGMIKSINEKSARQIMQYREKNGDLTSLSQLDSVCHKGFAAKLVNTN